MPEPPSTPAAPGQRPAETMHPSLVLTVYAEELITGARVAVFGHATLPVADELLERGARLVHVYDVDPGRIAEATGSGAKRSIFYASLSESGDIGVRDGAFDFVLVPDLSFVDRPEALLGLARRILSPSGSLLVASPNKDAGDPLVRVGRADSALGYYELYEAVAAHFRFVKMIGQAPFVGYAVAEFAVDEEPEPTIDTSLAQEKEPDFFVVLASDRPTRLDPFALIELPRSELRLRGADESDAAVTSDVRSASHEAAARVAEVERERDEAREARGEIEQRAHAERIRADQALQRLGARDEELSLLRERAENLRRSLEDEEARRGRLEVELDPLRPELGSLRDRIEVLEKTLAAAADEQMIEVARLEAHLRDRGREIEQLRAELFRRERLVREMVADAALSFPQPPSPPQPPSSPPSSPPPESPSANPEALVDGVVDDLRSQLDRLALEASRREADLVAAGWKIAELQRRLEQLQR